MYAACISAACRQHVASDVLAPRRNHGFESLRDAGAARARGDERRAPRHERSGMRVRLSCLFERAFDEAGQSRPGGSGRAGQQERADASGLSGNRCGVGGRGEERAVVNRALRGRLHRGQGVGQNAAGGREVIAGQPSEHVALAFVARRAGGRVPGRPLGVGARHHGVPDFLFGPAHVVRPEEPADLDDLLVCGRFNRTTAHSPAARQSIVTKMPPRPLRPNRSA